MIFPLKLYGWHWTILWNLGLNLYSASQSCIKYIFYWIAIDRNLVIQNRASSSYSDQNSRISEYKKYWISKDLRGWKTAFPKFLPEFEPHTEPHYLVLTMIPSNVTEHLLVFTINSPMNKLIQFFPVYHPPLSIITTDTSNAKPSLQYLSLKERNPERKWNVLARGDGSLRLITRFREERREKRSHHDFRVPFPRLIEKSTRRDESDRAGGLSRARKSRELTFPRVGRIKIEIHPALGYVPLYCHVGLLVCPSRSFGRELFGRELYCAAFLASIWRLLPLLDFCSLCRVCFRCWWTSYRGLKKNVN